jgi:hypothetical protein
MQLLSNIDNQHVELGKVTWMRDYKDALGQCELTGKPILLLFQEIPGCNTCVNFGMDVLSHPLMVEFIENEFVPLAIYNNRSGKDKDILNLYRESAWNNPVVYFINKKGHKIIPKLANNYQPTGLYNKMVETLIAAKRSIPAYARLLGDDLKMDYGYFETTIYEAPCFWSGETTFISHPAIKYTEAGWIGGMEVVKVIYDQNQVSLEELDNFAAQEGFFVIGNHEYYKIDRSPQYYLSNSHFKYLPLSRAQRAQINKAIPYREQPEGFLSPNQKQAYREVLNGTNIGKSKTYVLAIEDSWQWKA